MSHRQEISRAHKGLVVFVIDQSASMSEEVGNSGETKRDLTARLIDSWLFETVVRFSPAAEIKDCLDVGMIGYRTDSEGNPVIDSAFGGALRGRVLASIAEIAENPANRDELQSESQNRRSAFAVPSALPRWVIPQAEGGTPTCSVLHRCHSIVEDWIDAHRDSFPPIVIHITDGESSEGDPVPYAEAILDLATEDGNVLLFNCLLSGTGNEPVLFPDREEALSDPLARMLFRMSSPIPATLRQAAGDRGGTVLRDGARGMAFVAGRGGLERFLDLARFAEMGASAARADDRNPPGAAPSTDSHSVGRPAATSPTTPFAPPPPPTRAPAGTVSRTPSAPPSGPASPPPPPAKRSPVSPPSEPPRLHVDDNVQFTTYCPQTVQPETFHAVLAFAHLSKLPPDAGDDVPDPVKEVQRQAGEILGKSIKDYDVTRALQSELPVPRESEITFVLEMPGFRCNPPKQTIYWEEPVHRVEFRIKAPHALDGTVCRGHLSVYLGDIQLARAVLRVEVSSRGSGQKPPRPERTDVKPYRRIFASYSRRDTSIVRQFERYAATLGDRYLRDVVEIRAGEKWNPRLMEMIREADVFQLFWSSNSMQSPYVQQEYEYALSLGRENFIRPLYWEDPLPRNPPTLPPRELEELHFQQLGRYTRSTSDAPPAADDAPPAAGPAQATALPSAADGDLGASVTDDEFGLTEDSGVDLSSLAADSGVSLERAGPGGIVLSDPADSGVSLESIGDSSGDIPLMGAESDVDESGFEVPQSDDDGDYELSMPRGDSDEGDDSSVIALDDEADDSESFELADSGDEVESVESFDDEFAPPASAQSEDDEFDGTDVLDDAAEDFDESLPAGKSHAKLPAPTTSRSAYSPPAGSRPMTVGDMALLALGVIVLIGIGALIWIQFSSYK